MADDDVTPARSLFEALAESAPDAIITIDAGSVILSANSAVRRVFGWEPSELIGKPMTVLMPERLRDRHKRGLARYLRSGAKAIPWTGTQLTGLTRDEREIPIEISFGEFVDPDGRPVFSGFIRDISDRFNQQQAIETANAELQLQAHMLASVEQAIISTDLAGTVLTWNEFAATLYGWSSAEAIGRKLSDLVPPVGTDDEEEAGAAMKKLRAGQKVAYERRVRRRDGESIWISVIAAPIRDADGRVTRVVGTSTDITERRRLEEHYLQAQKMDAIGRLAGGIAHDFNNLLTVITGHAELLASQIPPTTEAGTDVGEIVKAAARAAALTRQLLAFSRQQTLDQQPLDVNAVITDLERMLSRLLDAQIQLELDLAADVPVVVADQGQLEQVIVNLVVNARDAMPEGGELCVKTRRVDLQSGAAGRPAGTYATIAVSDEGHGMTPEVRERIFEPFYTTKEQGKGTGLGLATVYGIVKQSRGFLDVASAVGEGSTFTLYLPATERMARNTPAIGAPVYSSTRS